MAVSIGAIRGWKKEQTYRSIDGSQYWCSKGRKVNRPMAVSTGAIRSRKKEQIYGSQYWCNQGQEKGTDL